MGSPRSPSCKKTRLRLPWKKRSTRKSPRERLRFWPSGDFAGLMSRKDKKNARATLAAQQYLHGVFPDARVRDVVAFGASDDDAAAAPSPFLAGVFGGRGDPPSDAAQKQKRAIDARAQ